MLVRLARALGIQPGEGSPVAWLIVHSLFNGVFSALFLTAANALFLARFPIGALPVAYIAASVVGYLAVSLLSRLEQRVSFSTLLMLNLGALLSLTSAFWIVRRFTDADSVVFLMFVAVGPMFSLIQLGYWGLAGRLFDLRQAKRLFGLVGAGEEVSTIAGLFSTPLLIRLVGGTGNLVLLAAVGLAGSFVTVVLIGRHFRGGLETGSEAAGAAAKAGVRLVDLLKVRYFLLMAACAILITLALYTIDFSFLAQIRLRFQGPGQIAQFFGVFFGAVKIVELLLKVLVSGPLLSQFGLNVGLLLLPILLSLSAGLAIVVGSLGLGDANFFVLVALSKMLAVSGRTSMFEPSFRVLYQPVAASDRIVYQSHVEGTARQLAVGVVGVALLLFSRGGAFNALYLFYVLLPILALWIIAGVFAHREYRVRLFEGLKVRSGGVDIARPVDVMTPFLQSENEDERRRALRMLERVDPGALPAALRRALQAPTPDGRIAALECIGASQLLELEPELSAIAAAGLDAAAAPAAERASLQLRQVRSLQADRTRVDALAGSADASERLMAAVAMGYGRPGEAERLSVLLWDRDARVRQAALVSAGRLGSLEFRPMLVRHLGVPTFAAAAASALVAIGPGIVPELERAFAQADQTPAVRRRILKILHDIGGSDALALLADKLESPERTVRRRAIELLAGAGYRASAAQASLIERIVETLIRDLVWDMNVLVALGESRDFAAVRTALEAELEEGRRWLFDLLSLVYDPVAIASVRDIVASGSAHGMVHALEILELLLSPVLKPFVFPILEGQTPAATVRKMEALVPREHFTPYEALRALVRRDYGRIGLWTRAVALDCLGCVADGVTADLVAFLFHPEPMIREIAAVRVVAQDPGAWATHRRRLQFDVRQSLESVIGTGDIHGEAEARSIFGRTLLLRKVPALSALPPEDLIALAGSSEVRAVQPQQELPSPRDPQHAFFVTLRDDLVLTMDGGLPLALPRYALFTFEPGGPKAEAQADAVLIRVDPMAVFELAAEEPHIIPGLLSAADTLNRYAHA